MLAFARSLLDRGELQDAIGAFAEAHAPRGERAAVGQLLLKLTTPGVPDVYQGDELWALSMVDPDNRRPVDFDARRAALDQLASGEEIDRANVKMQVIRRALALRSRRPETFEGAYRPLAALYFSAGRTADGCRTLADAHSVAAASGSAGLMIRTSSG